MRKIIFATLALALAIVCWPSSARTPASLAGVVIDVDRDAPLVQVIVRVRVTHCEFNCPEPRYTKTNDQGQFSFYHLAPPPYELDVIDSSGSNLLHREIITNTQRQIVVSVSSNRTPHQRSY